MKINCEGYPHLNIEVDAGSINSNLKGVIGLPDDTDSIENLKDEQYVQGAGDAIESFLLALAGEGVDLSQPVYGKALATFLDAFGNSTDDRPLPAHNDSAVAGVNGEVRRHGGELEDDLVHSRECGMPQHEDEELDEYAVIHLPTGELQKDGFASEDEGYAWLKDKQAKGELEPPDLDQYAVEKCEDDFEDDYGSSVGLERLKPNDGGCCCRGCGASVEVGDKYNPTLRLCEDCNTQVQHDDEE